MVDTYYEHVEGGMEKHPAGLGDWVEVDDYLKLKQRAEEIGAKLSNYEKLSLSLSDRLFAAEEESGMWKAAMDRAAGEAQRDRDELCDLLNAKEAKLSRIREALTADDDRTDHQRIVKALQIMEEE